MHVLWSRRWVAPAAAAVGAMLGVLFVWLQRPDPAPCVTTPDGLRACMPIYVEPVQGWAYLLAAVIGATVGVVGVIGLRAVRRRAGP